VAEPPVFLYFDRQSKMSLKEEIFKLNKSCSRGLWIDIYEAFSVFEGRLNKDYCRIGLE
jgi:hypothetical protein